MIDISKITDYLYVGSRMGNEHAEELKLLKCDLIISMIGHLKPHEVYTKAPFKSIWIRTFDTFLTPISVKKLLLGVNTALPVIQSGGKVLVFCMQGRRRSVAMASAILIAMGYTAADAAKLLVAGRKIADPERWYIRKQIHAFEKYWLHHHPRTDNTPLDNP
jgi:hypothetical protein